eukprot:4777487-Pleurochrysis_carterae.AAC.2
MLPPSFLTPAAQGHTPTAPPTAPSAATSSCTSSHALSPPSCTGCNGQAPLATSHAQPDTHWAHALLAAQAADGSAQRSTDPRDSRADTRGYPGYTSREGGVHSSVPVRYPPARTGAARGRHPDSRRLFIEMRKKANIRA